MNEISATARKSLSQNFLIDGNILRKIVKDVTSLDHVLEIGAGPGALTEILLHTGASVLAIEKDRLFATALERFQPDHPHLKIICADFLDLSLSDILHTKTKVIANLPYHLTTPILVKLLEEKKHFSSFTLMVQKEVADRFVAEPRTKDYSSFTLFLQYHAEVSYGFTVEPTCFFPQPKVQSAVVHLKMKPERDLPAPAKFFQLVRTAFQQRRKMLRSTLKKLYPLKNMEECLTSLGLNPLARPEELSLEAFIGLYLSLEC